MYFLTRNGSSIISLHLCYNSYQLILNRSQVTEHQTSSGNANAKFQLTEKDLNTTPDIENCSTYFSIFYTVVSPTPLMKLVHLHLVFDFSIQLVTQNLMNWSQESSKLSNLLQSSFQLIWSRRGGLTADDGHHLGTGTPSSGQMDQDIGRGLTPGKHRLQEPRRSLELQDCTAYWTMT